MRCELCGRAFPDRRGRFCGTCVEFPRGSGVYVPAAEIDETNMEFRYIHVTAAMTSPPRWEVRTTREDALIGWIRWYSPWRRFVFLPCEGTVWSTDCLLAVQSAIQAIARENHPQRSRRSRTRGRTKGEGK